MTKLEILAGQQSSPRGPALRGSLRRVTIAWMFGSVWMTATSGAPITLFAKSLHASPFQFGLLAGLPFIASLISMPAGLITDRTGERKKMFLLGLYSQRLLWIPIALLPLWLARNLLPSSGVPIAAFLLLVFFMYCGQAIGGPAWTSWMADIVPERSRGKYFGRRRCWGILTAIPAAVITGWILDRVTNNGQFDSSMDLLRWCGYIFIAAAIFGLTDIALFQGVPSVTALPQKHDSILRFFYQPLRDPQFLWFAGYVGTLTFAVSFMGQFVTLYMIDKLHVTNMQTQLMLIVAPSVAQLFVLTGWGKAVDRLGKKPVLALASLGLVPVGLGWCFMNSGAIWFGYLLSGVGAALWAGIEVANFNMVLEMSGADKPGGASNVAVNSIIINIAGCLGGIIAGLIAQWLHDWTYDLSVIGLANVGSYEVLFALSGMMRLLAVVVFLPKIHEPQAKPTHDALRFMTANIYNNLFNAVLLPLRVARLKVKEQQTIEHKKN